MNDWNEFFRRLNHQLQDFAHRRPLLAHMAGWAGGFALLFLVFGRDGKSSVAVMLVAAVIAAAAGAAVGAVAYSWERHVKPRLLTWRQTRLVPFLRTRAGVLTILAVVVVVVVAGLAVLLAAQPEPKGGTFHYPPTLKDCGALVLLVVFSFMFGAAPGGRQRWPDGSENARYLALGLALLAVGALALWMSQKELAASGSSLPQFFGTLRWDWHFLPGLHALGLGVLLLLAVIGLFHVAIGWRGPFPKRGLRGAGGDIFWLVAAAGLWWCNAFLPKSSFGWFDALDIHWAWYTVNFGLKSLYLFLIVQCCVTIALLMGGGGSAGGEIGGNTSRRNERMYPGRR